MRLVRGGVYFADLPGIGDKPVLIVSWEAINRANMSPIVVRITATERERSLPTHVALVAGEAGLSEPSWVLCHDVFTLPPTRFRRQAGTLPMGRMLEVEAALRRAFDL